MHLFVQIKFSKTSVAVGHICYIGCWINHRELTKRLWLSLCAPGEDQRRSSRSLWPSRCHGSRPTGTSLSGDALGGLGEPQEDGPARRRGKPLKRTTQVFARLLNHLDLAPTDQVPPLPSEGLPA